MKRAVPVSKCDVCDLLIDDVEVICVSTEDMHHTRSVNDMTYAQVKYFINDEDTKFYRVEER